MEIPGKTIFFLSALSYLPFANLHLIDSVPKSGSEELLCSQTCLHAQLSESSFSKQ